MRVPTRLTAIGAQTLSYDANGNLTGDGARTYVWNARNQLAQIKNAAGAVLASFGYDALGRRHSKTVNGVASGYLYDGANIAQELIGVNASNANAANVRANYLSGGVDEVFAQWSGSGAGARTTTYLTDALGSVVRLTDAAGNKLVDYTYDPYGATTADAANANPFQYTGRENDGNGLYYYRARYYAPGLGRFISSDPIGLAGGINMYAYVGGNPVSLSDPLGLDTTITTYPGAGGFGHIGIGVNSQNTTGFYPAPNASIWSLMTGDPVPGVMLPDTRTPNQTITIPTTPAQDKAIQDFIDARQRNPGIYDLNDRNCTTTVHDALNAGGINTPDTIYPNNLMNFLQQQFGGQR